MKKLLFLPFCLLIFLSGCAIQKNSEDLNGFTVRMNELNEGYNLTPEGFLYSEKENIFYKFFIINEKEVLVSFNQDNKNRLIKMDIVFETNFLDEIEAISFINNSLHAFIFDDSLAKNIISKNNFEKILKAPTNETTKIKNGNVEILIDVTELGVVLTVYKDI